MYLLQIKQSGQHSFLLRFIFIALMDLLVHPWIKRWVYWTINLKDTASKFMNFCSTHFSREIAFWYVLSTAIRIKVTELQ